jgi:pimeloyl-ACP methyl ester carboxylesterase
MILAHRERGTGPVLVLLHAFPFDSSMWKPQIDVLAATHRALAPDLPGFGQSPLVPGWTIDSAADLVAEWLNEIGVKEPVSLGGLSMGGYIAMAFARRHPQRLRKLILADTKAAADDAPAKAGRAATIDLAKTLGSAAVARTMLPKLLGETTKALRPAVVEQVLAMMERQSPASIVAVLEALRDRPDATPGLKDVQVPTLVLVGEEDAITPPAMAKIIAENVKGSKLVAIPKAGHLLNLESSRKFTAVVRDDLSL